MTAMRRILVCAPDLPEFDRESGSRRVFDLITFMRDAGWAVSFVSETTAGGERYVRLLEQRGVTVYRGFGEQVEQAIVHARFDLALFVFWHAAERHIARVRTLAPATRIAIDSVDLHFVRHARQGLRARAELELQGLGLQYGHEVVRELNAYAFADGVLAVSEKEAQLVSDLTGDALLGHCVPDAEQLAPSTVPLPDRRGILFLGNFRHEPNVASVEFLCRDVIPCIDRDVLAQHPLSVVGNDLRGKSLAITSGLEHVTPVGWVPSVVPYLEHARVTAIPLLFGAGTKRKLLQALMVGTPTVSTSVGIEGFDVRHGEQILVADDPVAFARALETLLVDDRLWRQLHDNGRDVIAASHSSGCARAAFLTAVERICTRTPKPGPDGEAALRLRQRIVETEDLLVRTRVRELVDDAIPKGSSVAVITKGDPELIQFEEHTGMHFPQDDRGEHLGYWPLDSAAAIKHLEESRRRGAEYLVVPSTYDWWLHHYADFGAYLANRYTELRHDEACVVFELRPRVAPEPAAAPAAEPPRIELTPAETAVPVAAAVAVGASADTEGPVAEISSLEGSARIEAALGRIVPARAPGDAARLPAPPRRQAPPPLPPLPAAPALPDAPQPADESPPGHVAAAAGATEPSLREALVTLRDTFIGARRRPRRNVPPSVALLARGGADAVEELLDRLHARPPVAAAVQRAQPVLRRGRRLLVALLERAGTHGAPPAHEEPPAQAEVPAQAPAPPRAVSPRPRQPVDYAALRAGALAAAAELVPADATVAVLTKGDPDLLRIPGRRALHFPADDRGGYLGYWPANGEAAIALLEQARAAGAEYLLLPSAYDWWLHHYAEFGAHLAARYIELDRNDACTIFDLRDREPLDADARLRQLVAQAVPEGAVLAVVNEGDPALLAFDGRGARHFPHDEHGDYLGYWPLDSAAAIECLEQARTAGAEYLLLPRTYDWWLDHYAALAEHLATRYHELRHDDAGVVFDLRPSAAGRAPSALVAENVPEGAVVAVVNEGDPALLAFDRREGRHFPHDEHGDYLGYWPLDSAAAIECLEQARAAGAEYLLLPSAYDWWLDHYAALAEHLATRYRELGRDEEGVVFDLRGGASEATGWETLEERKPSIDEGARRAAALTTSPRVLALGICLAGKPNAFEHISTVLAARGQVAVEQRWLAIGGHVGAAGSDVQVVTTETLAPKFELLNGMLEREELELYDYVLICDDDIVVPDGFADVLIGLQERLGFALAQPARTSSSFVDHPITRQQLGVLARRTSFVEIGPVFSVHRSAFDLIFPFDLTSPMGWGYENVWARQLRDAGLTMGIVDAVPVDHGLRPPVANYSWTDADAQRSALLAARAHLPLAECLRVLEVITE